jgi:hypothetical protein
MRYRNQILDANGDMQFGHGSADFWYNQVEAVGQAIKTRLLLFTGEWFLDITEGMPWGGFPLNDFVVAQGQVLGTGTAQIRDIAIKQRVLSTPGVLSIIEYSSNVIDRRFTVNMTVNTIYGATQLALSGVSSGDHFTLDDSPLDSGVPLG